MRSCRGLCRKVEGNAPGGPCKTHWRASRTSLCPKDSKAGIPISGALIDFWRSSEFQKADVGARQVARRLWRPAGARRLSAQL